MRGIVVDYSPGKDASLEEHRKSKIGTSPPKPMPFNFSWGTRGPLRLYITAEDDEFDENSIQHWKDEGFEVTFLPYNGDPKEFGRKLMHMGGEMELADKWALVAYSEAASVALACCIKPVPKLCALVAYYPTRYTPGCPTFPSSLSVQIHLASTQSLEGNYPAYTYDLSAPGFAEEDLDEYSKISARLAWSRSLRIVREAFEIKADLEKIWEDHLNLEFVTKDVDKTMATMVKEPYVNHVPTMTGGIGYKDLHAFYKDFFIPCNPSSMKMRLLSRTIGTDRVVDEMHISFIHTCEIPWMLPGVPPTDKRVEVALVSVVCIRGGKIYHEHIYWDQATVLLQIGLLDPKLMPPAFKGKVKRMPVLGAESARKVVNEEVGVSNKLIPGWRVS